jgi:hypothetical protein
VLEVPSAARRKVDLNVSKIERKVAENTKFLLFNNSQFSQTPQLQLSVMDSIALETLFLEG